MRQRTLNYFLGSLFSRQFIYAYGIAGGLVTLTQLGLIWNGKFRPFPTRTDKLPLFVELYIETLLPVWIGGITLWNAAMVGMNILFALVVLGIWTWGYSQSY